MSKRDDRKSLEDMLDHAREAIEHTCRRKPGLT